MKQLINRLLIASLFVVCVILIPTNVVKAETWGIGGDQYFTINIDKSTYAPGEVMNVSGGINNVMYDSSNFFDTAYLRFDGTDPNYINTAGADFLYGVWVQGDGWVGSVPPYNNAQHNAPNTPGNYDVKIWLTVNKDNVGGDTAYVTIPYTIGEPVSITCTNGATNPPTCTKSCPGGSTTRETPPSITEIVNTGTIGGTKTQAFRIGDSVLPGDVFSITVYTHSIYITAVSGDTASSITTKLRNAVDATTAGQWNDHQTAPPVGTPGFKPTTNRRTDNELGLTLNYQNGFAAGVTPTNSGGSGGTVTATNGECPVAPSGPSVIVYANGVRNPVPAVTSGSGVEVTWDTSPDIKSCACSYIDKKGVTQSCGAGTSFVGGGVRSNPFPIPVPIVTTFTVTCDDNSGTTVVEPVVEPVAGSCPYYYPTCFIADTLVTMADGTKENIQDVKVGDVLKGDTTDNTVLGLHRPELNGKLYSFNGGRYFVTAEHPFKTINGWKSINPALTASENIGITVTPLKIGDTLITDNGNVLLKTIDSKVGKADTDLYNFILDGDHTYYADGYLVHNKMVCKAGEVPNPLNGQCSSTCTLSNNNGCPVGYTKSCDGNATKCTSNACIVPVTPVAVTAGEPNSVYSCTQSFTLYINGGGTIQNGTKLYKNPAGTVLFMTNMILVDPSGRSFRSVNGAAQYTSTDPTIC